MGQLIHVQVKSRQSKSVFLEQYTVRFGCMWDTVKCKENKFNQTSAYQWKTKMSSFDQLWHFDTVFSSWLYSRGGHMVIWASSPRCQTSTSAPFSNARVVRLTWPSSYYSVALKCCQHTLAGLESRSFLSRDLDSLHHSPAVLFTHNGSWLLVYSFFFHIIKFFPVRYKRKMNASKYQRGRSISASTSHNLTEHCIYTWHTLLEPDGKRT